jgi:molybdenum cofactor biosynthesis enzyme MoaA
MAYLELSEIREFHVEMTNSCNASCPQCSRNILGGPQNPLIEKAELSLEDIKSIIPPALCPQIEQVMFCGTYGDPIVAKDSLLAVNYLKSSGTKSVWFYTNASARDSSWWKSMAKILTSPNDRLIFSVDGLEDTNHLYRRGTSWDRVFSNMETFIQSGGNARWDFLVFKHNEHQVDLAKEMAKKMGFLEFRLRKTSRFSAPLQNQTNRRMPVIAKSIPGSQTLNDFIDNLKLDEVNAEYWLEQPYRVEYQNHDTTVRLKEIIDDYGDFNKYLDAAEISCIYKNRFKRLYVSADARLWPCSYIYGDVYSWSKKHKYRDDIRKNILGVYGTEFNDLRKHNLSDILRHPWFESDLEKSWTNSTNEKTNPRLLKCARTCGHRFNPILSQTKQVSLQAITKGSNT